MEAAARRFLVRPPRVLPLGLPLLPPPGHPAQRCGVPRLLPPPGLDSLPLNPLYLYIWLLVCGRWLLGAGCC